MNDLTKRSGGASDVASIERRLIEMTAAIAQIRESLGRIGIERREASSRLAVAETALPEAQLRVTRRRAAREQAVRERGDLERRYADLLENETTARARFEQAEQRADAFRAVASFARSARETAEGDGDEMRAGRERDAEGRAIADAVSIEREDVELHVLAERAVEDEVESGYGLAEADRERIQAEIARAKATLERLAGEETRFTSEIAALDAEKLRRVDELTALRERVADDGVARISELRLAEDRKRAERVEAERVVAELRAEEEALATERAALERAERERVERRRAQEAREQYERNLDERRERRRVEEMERGPSATSGTGHLGRPSAPALPKIDTVPGSIAASIKAPADDPPADVPPADAGVPTADAGTSGAAPRIVERRRPVESGTGDAGVRTRLGGMFQRRRKADLPPPEPEIDVASRIARDFGLLGVVEAPRSDDPPDAG